MSGSNFRAVIVGGGPAGLTAAHTLSKAGIEFVILEGRPNIIEDTGASLILHPGGMRALAQLGLWSQLQAIGTVFQSMRTSIIEPAYAGQATAAIGTVKDNFGTDMRVFHRAELVAMLYNELSDEARTRVLTSKKVASIESDEAGVRVNCVDGTSYDGSIVIGADGVHSKTRQEMRSLALKASPDADVNDENMYMCEYRTMWCTFPSSGFDLGTATHYHGKDKSTQYMTSPDRAWIFVYERLPKPTRERVSYSEDDVEAFADRMGDLPIAGDLKVRDAFSKRYHAGMANLEEGIMKHWSWGRLVLAGDAAHKFTPNTGVGYQNGIQDIVVLTNEIQHLLQSGPEPSVDALGGAFKRYHSTRIPLVEEDLSSTGLFTRRSAWRYSIFRFIDIYIWPYVLFLEYPLMKILLTGRVKQEQVLDFLPSTEAFTGKVPWDFPMKSPVVQKSD